MEISKDILIQAFSYAVIKRREYEHDILGYDKDSAMVEVWHKILVAVERGDNIKIKE